MSAYLVCWETERGEDHSWYCSEDCAAAASEELAQIRAGLLEGSGFAEEPSCSGLVCESEECPRDWEEL